MSLNVSSALWTDERRVCARCLPCSMAYVMFQSHPDRNTLHTEGEKVMERGKKKKPEQGERDDRYNGGRIVSKAKIRTDG